MPAAPTRRGEVTRQRLLEAAAAEFAERGIAGARVDRIVATARSNKAQLYQYFGSKERLFDEVFSVHIEWLIAEVHLDERDLPGYAVALYDVSLRRPELVRLAAWMRLERNPSGDLRPGNPDAGRISAIAAAQTAGRVDPAIDPADILSMITAMALSWSPASLQIAASADEADAIHDRRRAALATAVRQAFVRPA
ncbi:TetR family transcriptional regulator [Mycolicibacterium baixiangningiae]|uniref:TetR family transcriptional regulator n=1 Tax=Mycolicibacterium baixiangningiae TaxID=2761578 RepID=UPI0018692C18|nr:TetR family transcriptional regulator [Mycolicibacterium baixiangningiae]